MKDKTQNLRLTVRLTPKSARNAIKGWAEDAAGDRFLKAGVTAAPEKGKANKALIELLANSWGIPKSSIQITRGETERNKVLIINDVSEEIIRTILSSGDL